MSYITINSAQAWLEETKLTLGEIDSELEDSIVTQIIGRLASTFDTSSWLNTASTPSLVLKIMSMHYVAWYYDRQYSEDTDGNGYAARLRSMAEQLIIGLIDGSVELVGANGQESPNTGASFYPNDISSAEEPTLSDLSLGKEVFSMGKVF